MGIFSSKKGKLARSGKDTNSVESKKKTGFSFRRIMSFMFATTESKERKAAIDVYSRPTFRKSLEYEPGKGYSSADLEYAANIRCANFRTTGIKRSAYMSFDFDSWSTEEMTAYDKRFIPIELNDETVDMMKMSVAGIEFDAMEIDDFGEYSEADITYEEIEIPMAKPAFLPEIIREEVQEEEVEEPIVEAPVEIPVVDVPVEEPVAQEIAVEAVPEVPVQIEAPAVAGLIDVPKDDVVEIQVVEEKVEEPIVETPVVETPVIETPVVEEVANTFSFGFGGVSEAQAGEVTMSFGFGIEPEVKEETSSFIANAVFAGQDDSIATSM